MFNLVLKKIMCINTTDHCAYELDRIFHESEFIQKLGRDVGYNEINTSTLLKMMVLHFVSHPPSQSKIKTLYHGCKDDSFFLSSLTGEKVENN
jgi:hypothetical protein